MKNKWELYENTHRVRNSFIYDNGLLICDCCICYYDYFHLKGFESKYNYRN
jgi:hypothetical protein